jgi:hypothetical protein
LSDEAGTSGAQCRAHGEFPRTGGGARQEQTGDICAGDQEYKAYRSEQHPKHRADASYEDILHGRYFDWRLSLGVQHRGMSHGILAMDHRHLRLGLREAQPGVLAAEYDQKGAQEPGLGCDGRPF